MAGLLDSARDFERWLADINSRRPISHPMPLDPSQMYQMWLQQQAQQAAPPYQAVQMPAALSELSAMSPSLPAAPLTLQDPAALRQPPPPARPSLAGSFGARMTGPQSRNIEDERTPITAEDVSNWLRKPYADDEDWRSTWIGGGNGFLR